MLALPLLDWFLDPWFLALVPLVAGFLLFRWRRQRAALPIASFELARGMPKTLRVRLCRLPLILSGLAAVLVAMALARPVTRDVMPIHAQGVEIVLVVDVSSSMLADDMERDDGARRIDVAREQALRFAEARVHDRIGLVTFALFPDVRCPLTLDKKALAAFLRGVDTVVRGSPEDRTAIGVALAKAVALLGDVGESKVVVLLTDGENNVSDIEPDAAAKLAKDNGVRVHTIGLGQGMVGPFGFVHEPDFSALSAIAETTGGKFFAARNADDLAAVYAEIDRLEKQELEDPRYRTTDWYEWPLGAAAGLLLLALFTELAWIRGAP